MNHINMLLTFDITNLFNRRNVNDIFNFTGAPYKFGDVDANDVNTLYPWRKAENRLNPTAFNPGRQILLGLKMTWE